MYDTSETGTVRMNKYKLNQLVAFAHIQINGMPIAKGWTHTFSIPLNTHTVVYST